MRIRMYRVNAFTDKKSQGNPAAICLLGDRWLSDKAMQNIARENNLSETAFHSIQNGISLIRWFTPAREVDLCGHATLATAYVLFMENRNLTEVEFVSRSGVLKAKKKDDMIALDFPADRIEKTVSPPGLSECFSIKPREVYKGISDFMLIYGHESQIRSLQVDFEKLSQIDMRGVIVTAPDNRVDFVSRFFAPRYGVNEDPVTGSAHTTLTKYWSEVLGKTTLQARQLSERGGYLICEDKGNRVGIAGEARLYFEGYIYV